MKHIAQVLTFAATFAASAPAQAAQDPLQELAVVIAAEEQEGDLAKAEKGYREAIAGGKLSTEGRLVAHMRLAKLLRKLDRAKEAEALMAALLRETPAAKLADVTGERQGQDVERERALREQAKGLVQQVLDDPKPSEVDPSSKLFAIRPAVAEQLLWIGQPAVPVVIAALEDLAKASTYSPNVIAGLAGFLWRTGGPQAAEFLKTCAKQGKPQLRGNAVRTAYQANRPEMLSTAEAFLDDPEPRITFNLLGNADQNAGALEGRLDDAVLLDMAERGGPERKAYILDLATRRMFSDPPAARRIVQLVRQGFASTDPAVGTAARKCLESRGMQSCVDGIELLLREAPKLRDAKLSHWGPPSDAGAGRENGSVEVSREVGKRLWPLVVASLRTLEPDHPLELWVRAVASWVVRAVGPESVPDLLGLVDAGLVSPPYAQTWLQGLVTAENAVAVLSRYERLGDWPQRRQFLGKLYCDLPPAAFLVLRDKAELQRRETPGDSLEEFARVMVRTGHPDAAEWITAEWQRRSDDHDPRWAIAPLISLGRRTQDEKVRIAMRTLLGSTRLSGVDRSQLLLALLSMRDVPALEIWVHEAAGAFQGQHKHPYSEGFLVTVRQYLFEQDQKPPHGFTEDELSGLLVQLAKAGNIQHVFSWQDYNNLSPRLHGEVARLQMLTTPPRSTDWSPNSPGNKPSGDVRHMLAGTVLQRARTQEGQQSPLRDWVAIMLREPRAEVREAVLAQLETAELEPQRALVETFLDGDDESLAFCAARMLGSTQVLFDPTRLAKNRHPGLRQLAVQQWASTGKEGGEDFLLPLLRDVDPEVRQATAEFFGACVSKAAVPDLIALLRDPTENVRKAAADALTRVRFFHEQQAHWDRVLKGLDASPASAAEKLLLQAKPGAPKAQRLLAITSLGTIAVPEALPFLIEWTTDPDAELAAAATAAITQIHLNPRK